MSYFKTLLILFFIVSASSQADMIIQDIGDPSGVALMVKNQRTTNFSPLSLVEGGTEIIITKPSSYLDLVGDDGKTIRINSQNSPFLVPKVKTSGWLSNLVRDVSVWYNSPAGNEVTTISAIARGEGSEEFKIKGMDITNNFITPGVKQIRFSWSGGEPPFQVILEGINGNIYYKKITEDSFIDIDEKIFTDKKILFLVEGKSKAGKFIDAKKVTSVNSNSLPKDVINLLQSIAPSDIKDRLSVVMLSRYSQWRFYAHQLARGNAI